MASQQRPRAATGEARRILNAVLAELEKSPEDRETSTVPQLAFECSRLFVETILDQFAVPASEFSATPESDRRAHPCGRRTTWTNYVGTQFAQPFRIECPTSLAALRKVVERAAAERLPIRAVGSHHAWSDAALTDGVVIETTRLIEPLSSVDPSVLLDSARTDPLVVVSGGMTIGAINEALDKLDLGLLNMGGYDGQTLAGAISTSTHGSGLTLGAFPACVEALVVMRADGSLVQIERTKGITDPQKFKPYRNERITLVQNDKLFEASVVGIGCLGIIVAVVLRVTKRYFLKEVRTIESWKELRNRLDEGELLRSHRHVEVWINPHQRGADHSCLLTVRDVAPSEPGSHRPFRSLFAEFLASAIGADRVLAWLFNTFPRLSPEFIEGALRSLEQKEAFVDVSYKVLNIGASNNFAAVSSELGLDLDGHVKAADSMLALARDAEEQGTFHSGPIVLRYVAQSPGFLSMQPTNTCMIELPLLRDVFGADELLWRYEQLLTREFKARPHWGQRNFLTGSHNMVQRLYGETALEQWLDVFRSFNPNGEFHGRLTDRVGFTSHAPAVKSTS